MVGNENYSDMDSGKSWYVLAGKECFREDTDEESGDEGWVICPEKSFRVGTSVREKEGGRRRKVEQIISEQ